MTGKFTKSMFEKIKEAVEEQKNQGGYKDIMKTPVGHSYLVRLLPNIKNPANTFFHYHHHSWTSQRTGQFVTSICPTTYGEECPICEKSIQLYSNDEREKAKLIGRKENWLVNAYIIKNPREPKLDGSVKIIRYGRQLNKIIEEAINGEDAEEFGASIFDLSEDGCNFRIKVEKNDGGWATYVSSKFISSSPIVGMNGSKIKDTYDSIFDLECIFDKSSYDELEEMMLRHTKWGSTSKSTPSRDDDSDDDDDLDISDSSDDSDDLDLDDLDDKLEDVLKDLG